EGDNRIEILDVNTRDVDRSIRVQGVGAMQNPAWSPDGRYIAFSGIHGGISDLYLYDFQTGTVRQLTRDRFADIQPSWSPDGKTIVFSTDRGPGGTDFDKLFYSPVRLGFIDVATGDIRVSVPFEDAKHINPTYSPDGQSVYFISDRDGFSNVYRIDVATSQVSQVTNVATGVSGITALAPALSVASQTGAMMFSVYSDGNYSVFALDPDQTAGTPVTGQTSGPALAGFMPPAVKTDTSPVGYLAVTEPAASAQSVITSPTEPYHARLHLAYVGQPSVGVGYDQQFGGLGIAGGVSFYFTDMLGNHILGAAVQANGTIKDVGGQVQYINRAHRFNWGGQISHIPYLTGFAAVSPGPTPGSVEYDQYLQRYYFSGGQFMGAYPLSTTRRLEANVGYTHIGSSLERTRLIVDQFGNVRQVDRENVDTNFKGLHLVQGSGALVSDYSFFGFTSPVRGGRYRFEAGYTAGSHNFGTLLGDYRHYFFLNPLTFAVSGYTYGRYGPGADAPELYPLNLGYSTYNMRGVHGYGINSFDVSECRTINGCAVLDRVIGSSVAVASMELRLPFLGTRDFGLINFPYLPTELVAFFDGGVAWTADRPPVFKWETDGSNDNVPVFSTGAAARFNVLGYLVLEVFYAYPFQRPDKGGYVGLALLPGW
ncbi:MAG TPA: peptidase S9, partial [Rhodothermales bacterium]|nr:peptidase S9 [Rhodothermales bacterium]